MQEMWVHSLGWEDPFEKGMATHSSILAWWIPWTKEPGGLHYTGWQRAWHDWSSLAWIHTSLLASASLPSSPLCPNLSPSDLSASPEVEMAGGSEGEGLLLSGWDEFWSPFFSVWIFWNGFPQFRRNLASWPPLPDVPALRLWAPLCFWAHNWSQLSVSA